MLLPTQDISTSMRTIALPQNGRLLARKPRMLSVNVSSVSSSHRAGETGTSFTGGSQDAVELFVASYEDARKLAHDARSAAQGNTATQHRYPERRRVSSPRHNGNRFAVARDTGSRKVAEAAVKEQFALQQHSSKAIKAELDLTASELRNKTAEVAKLAKLVRGKDGEIDELKVTLADRDAKLKASKQDLLESRMMLQEKDNLLETAYEALTTACKERSELRAQLIEVQQELQDTRQELRKWTDEMSQLKSVMDALDAVDAETLSAINNDTFSLSKARDSSGNWADDGVATLLQELTQLTQQVVAEAAEDEKVFQQAMGHGNPALRSGGNAAYW